MRPCPWPRQPQPPGCPATTGALLPKRFGPTCRQAVCKHGAACGFHRCLAPAAGVVQPTHAEQHTQQRLDVAGAVRPCAAMVSDTDGAASGTKPGHSRPCAPAPAAGTAPSQGCPNTCPALPPAPPPTPCPWPGVLGMHGACTKCITKSRCGCRGGARPNAQRASAQAGASQGHADPNPPRLRAACPASGCSPKASQGLPVHAPTWAPALATAHGLPRCSGCSCAAQRATLAPRAKFHMYTWHTVKAALPALPPGHPTHRAREKNGTTPAYAGVPAPKSRPPLAHGGRLAAAQARCSGGDCRARSSASEHLLALTYDAGHLRQRVGGHSRYNERRNPSRWAAAAGAG